jgi:hypothetical protein
MRLGARRLPAKRRPVVRQVVRLGAVADFKPVVENAADE